MRPGVLIRRRGAAVVLLAAEAVAIVLAAPAILGSPGSALQHDPIDPNRAAAAELALLPGVGPSLAGAIVADRDASGPFRSVGDLDRVRGIGPATLARVAPFVAIRAAATRSDYASR